MTNIETEAKKELDLLLKRLGESKAEEVVHIDVSASSPFMSYVILATCNNTRFLGALQGELEDFLWEHDIPVSVKEGEPDSGWVIVQGQEVLIHLMLPSNRRALDLETLLAQINKKNKA